MEDDLHDAVPFLAERREDERKKLQRTVPPAIDDPYPPRAGVTGGLLLSMVERTVPEPKG
jgi:hypothetical protein